MVWLLLRFAMFSFREHGFKMFTVLFFCFFYISALSCVTLNDLEILCLCGIDSFPAGMLNLLCSRSQNLYSDQLNITVSVRV